MECSVKNYLENLFVKYAYGNVDKVFRKLSTLDKALDNIAAKHNQKAVELVEQSARLKSDAEQLAAHANEVSKIKAKIAEVSPSVS
jgi:hypothetical protein